MARKKKKVDKSIGKPSKKRPTTKKSVVKVEIGQNPDQNVVQNPARVPPHKKKGNKPNCQRNQILKLQNRRGQNR
ncbi:MAG: hypothetical protein KKB03_00435 [Nanoarchaeota archaeon]|nr:hypothetical protein [Nanoarchaeota archaeon]MBU1135454.1 hypothetical protein [Nanoarchaeota archaeon]MBU2519696.1 hypothetical protein [Nanoarchaeota archaeon]